MSEAKGLVQIPCIRFDGKNSVLCLIHVNNILNHHKISSINAFLMKKVKM